MSINKANLKKLLAPIIKECVREALSDKDLIQEIVLSSGVLSTVVKEVATGLNESRRSSTDFSRMIGESGPSQAIIESRRQRKQTRSQVSTLPPKQKRPPRASTEFEKTHQEVDRDYAGKRNTYGALAGSDPGDGGVSLSSFGLGGLGLTESKKPEDIGGVDISELTIGSRLK